MHRLLIGLVVSGGLSLLAGPASADPPHDDVATIVSALRHDPVDVEAASSLQPTPAQLRTLHDDVAAAPEHLYVVALGDLATDGDTTDIAAAVARHLPGHSWVVVYADDALPAFGGAYADDDRSEQFVDADAWVVDAPGTPVERLLGLTGRLGGRITTQPPGGFGDLDLGVHRDPPSTHVRVLRRVALGAGVAVLLVLGLLALRLAGRRGAGGWRAWRFTRRVASGRRADVAIRARREVLDLGTLLEQHEMAVGDDAEQWQAALDSYDRAGRLLDRASSTDELEQVVELCRQGCAQLGRARHGAGA